MACPYGNLLGFADTRILAFHLKSIRTEAHSAKSDDFENGFYDERQTVKHRCAPNAVFLRIT